MDIYEFRSLRQLVVKTKSDEISKFMSVKLALKLRDDLSCLITGNKNQCYKPNKLFIHRGEADLRTNCDTTRIGFKQQDT